ncbi:MAG: hypothetical protein ACK5FE_13320 [Cyanobacteriota bacterium]
MDRSDASPDSPTAADSPAAIVLPVVNRCAVSVCPRQPMRDWSRSFWTLEEREAIQEDQSLYLIDPYDSEEAGMELLRQHYGAIFRSELELWCRDQSRWPQARSFDLFQEWFELRFFPLVEDLGAENLSTYAVESEFLAAVAEVLESR